jgi:hypothetical protein
MQKLQEHVSALATRRMASYLWDRTLVSVLMVVVSTTLPYPPLAAGRPQWRQDYVRLSDQLHVRNKRYTASFPADGRAWAG